MSGRLRTRGQMRDRVRLENPTRIADGTGGFTETFTLCDPPEVYACLEPATVHDFERVIAGTVTATATYLVVMDYHQDVTIHTRLTKLDDRRGPRIFDVAGVQNVDERDEQLAMACSEVLA